MPQPLLKIATEKYRKSLPSGTLQEFRIDPVDYLGVPIVNVDFWAEDGLVSNGIGYGRTPEAAQLGAYGELCEERHTIAGFAELPQETGSYRSLVEKYGTEKVIDPLTLVLEAGSPYDEDYELQWVPIRRYADGLECWVPAEFVACSNGQVDYPNRLTTAIRNGSGAGDTETRALLHGTLELLQRDGNVDCFRALDRGLVIDPETLPQDCKDLIAELAEKGLHVTCKLARVTCGCVSVYAVGDDRTDDDFPLSVTATGEGADTDYRTALLKAITECASSHGRKRFNNIDWPEVEGVVPEGFRERILGDIDLAKEEARALDAMVVWLSGSRAELRAKLADNVFLEREIIDCRTLPANRFDTLEEQWFFVLEQLAAEGLTPYVFRSGTTGGHCHVVKMIVPGIEQELGSYHRLGERGVRRLLEREDVELISRQDGPGRKRVLLTEAAEIRLGGSCWLETDRLDKLIEPVYALYREPSAHAARYAIDQQRLGYTSDELAGHSASLHDHQDTSEENPTSNHSH
ncbi:YcaO-like family protein [Neolewinella antarctica]|uniref:Ribosomal protein S12 methylthiotransferase accessory factor n=1 Tax=Neolewinella antarctica TaxID=442734 RepID=A0ABX0XG25_9BACT|nr:YcaO-like family protein [Neolewinella antarctica]NJC28162.1 ribosomal protein S12 methylthiotransferase accessory factor [Neolewinella antarctica]